MFWIELLIAFLALIINYGGIMLLLRLLNHLYNVIRLHMFDTTVCIESIIVALMVIMLFIVPFPLYLILSGSIGLNPITVAGELLVALIVYRSGITEL